MSQATATAQRAQAKDWGIDRRIRAHLGPPGQVLDVGCGDGRLVAFLAQETGHRVVGLDIAAEGFAKARERARNRGATTLVECVKGDARRMEAFADHGFDAVVLEYTLHHLEDPLAVLKEVRRVLRPGGKLLIGDWFVRDGQAQDDCHKLTMGKLERLLVRAGFHPAAQEYVGTDGILLISR